MEHKQGHELAGIEVLRFVCAFGVLIWHYQHFFFVGLFNEAQGAAMRPAYPFYRLLRYTYEHGHWPVQIFWAVSGFIFYLTYAGPIFERRTGLGEFVSRRFSRLYPLHIVTLVLVAALQALYFHSHGQSYIYGPNNAQAFLAQLFFASNWLAWQPFTFNGPIWSISAEIMIYGVFFYVARAFGGKVFVAITVSILAWLIFKSSIGNQLISENVFECATLFFAGGVACWLSKHRYGIALIACSFAIALGLLAAGVIESHLGIAIFLAPGIVVAFVRLGQSKMGVVMRPFAPLGNATYSSYLIHFPIQLAIVITIDGLGLSRSLFLSPITFLAYLATVTASALLVYRRFEAPAQNWIRATSKRVALRIANRQADVRARP
jgi:peptidoglycan/LPS O-acetylase OafA/YrhL